MQPQASPYGILMLIGIGLSLFLWTRMGRRDPRLVMIYIGGLCGAFLGAKLVYVLAEGWLHIGQETLWLQLATGKTIIGALLGGYGGVEFAKHLAGYSASTGDRFAVIAPVAIILGRMGCLFQGCCPGVPMDGGWMTMTGEGGMARWPAVPAEILFNVVFLAALFSMRRIEKLREQHFHIYLIAYGCFRLAHETLRDTPKVFGPFSGYQLACLALIALGIVRFRQRHIERRKRAGLTQAT